MSKVRVVHGILNAINFHWTVEMKSYINISSDTRQPVLPAYHLFDCKKIVLLSDC